MKAKMKKVKIYFKPFTGVVLGLATILLFIPSCGKDAPKQQTSTGEEELIFFDDFSYTNTTEFTSNGWQIRSGRGHPGEQEATWDDNSISFHNVDNISLMRLSSTTDGTAANTTQSQVCHIRKYREGTYAARVFFRDEPVVGPNGDEVTQTFYTISPLQAPMDLNYSELDFEYLVNGGWDHRQALWITSWETFQHDPWTMDNLHGQVEKSYAGWHTLVIQATNNQVTYFVDGEVFFQHGEKVFPEDSMSINFNQWFIRTGYGKNIGVFREYQEDVDWVFFQKDTELTPAEIEEKVALFKTQAIAFNDDVPVWSPEVDSPCSL